MRTSLLRLSFLAALLAGAGGAASAAPDMIPHTIRDDFERGEINAWESYPIAEDPGFDPEIWCVREPAYGGSAYSLCKVIEPNDTDWPRDENLVGMTKKIRLWAAQGTELRLAAFAEGDRRPEEIRVVLYGADGRRYTWSGERPKANEWTALRLGRHDFRSGSAELPAGLQLEAVTVLARYNQVNPHRSYSLCLDDFRLSGERPRRIDAVEPSSTRLDKFFFAFLNRHFQRGETVSLSVRPEAGQRPVELVSLSGVLSDPAGVLRGKAVSFKPGNNGVWSSGELYRIGGKDPAGRWKLMLEGKGKSGEQIKDEVFFIVPEKQFAPADHPRLLFSSGDRESWKNGPMEPKRKKILDAAITSARQAVQRGNLADIVESEGVSGEFLDGGPVSPSWDQYARWSRPGNAMRGIVTAGAFVFAFTGDREVGQKAKEAMLMFARFRQWQNPWFLNRNMYTYYPVGLWTYAMGIGYDFLYPLFTPEERTLIRKAVMEKAIIPHYRDWVELNRKPSQVTNHIGMNSTGMLLAALAFLGEDPENPDMEPYLSGILAKYKAHIDAGYRPDGSYAEPEAYAGTDTQDLTICLSALERNLGIDWTTTTPVKNAYLYQLYLATANGRGCPAFGDGGRDWGFSLRNLHLWLAHRLKDPSAMERYRWQTESGAFAPSYTFFDFLWYPDQSIPSRPITDYPPSHWFRSKGNAVFRSGWDENALIFALKTGPHSNHYHLDQGTFWLLYNGETLLSEAGYVNYYTNLYYRQFNIQPISHNTLLLNGYPESQRIADLDDEVKARNEFPRITSCFTGKSVDAVEGELSCVYKGRLSQYSRSFVYLKDAGCIVLCDEVTAGEPERFSWVFNAEGKDAFKGDGNTVRVVRPKAELRMDILTPDRLTLTVKPHPDRDGSFIMLSTPEPSKAGAFLAVLTPSSPDNRAERETRKTLRIEGNGWTGAEIRRGDGTDRVVFRKASGGMLPAGQWETDGDRAAISESANGKKHTVWVRNGTYLRETGPAGAAVFQSDRKLSFLVGAGESETAIEVDSEEGATLSLKAAMKPASVLLDGKPVKFTFNGKTGMVTLAVSAGKHSLGIKR